MCTKGTDSATAAAIFNKIDEVVTSHNIPWGNCVGFGVDNTSVNVGIRNSIYTRVIQKNPACYFMGCPCHLVHNVACKASSTFSDVSGFDVEDMCVDVYYYFDKSTKRKSSLVEFAEFCDVKYRQVIKQVNTRWLSLEVAVKRSLQMYPALKSYFLSNSEAEARFKRLKSHFRDPMVEIYLQFYHAVLPTFTTVNLFLQREDPCIFAVYKQLRNFVKKAVGQVCVNTVHTRSGRHKRCGVYKERNWFIGFMTKQQITKMLNDGDVDARKVTDFFEAVRQFYEMATAESLAKLPLDDKLLLHARFVDFFQKEDSFFENVEYFIEKYPDLLPFSTATELEIVQEEFVDYQMLKKSDIPDEVWESARVKVTEEDEDGAVEEETASFFRMGSIWAYISSMKLADHSLKFRRLCKVAKTVLILPHSNAGEERVFSIKKNKTPFRGSLAVNGTLSSLMTIKLANCHQFEPPTEVLTSAKKATRNYNLLHKKS